MKGLIRHLPLSLFLATFFIFAVLLLKAPFSDRTLIPNLDPFPDSIHYLNPAINLLKEGKFLIGREGRFFPSSVPPLYSLVLIPFFLIKSDPRMFYFANLTLALLSFYVFSRIIKKITSGNIFIIGTSLFLYATNYYMYWYPTLAMAENLIILLFLFSVDFLISETSLKKSVLAGFMTLSFYATKYATIALSVSFFVLYAIRLLTNKKRAREKRKEIVTYLLASLIFWTTFFMFEQQLKGNSTLGFLIASLSGLIFGVGKLISAPEQYAKAVEAQPSWFSAVYIKKNLPEYLRTLQGNATRILWETKPIFAKYIAFPALLGLLGGLFQKSAFFLSLALLVLLVTPMITLSTFYTFDMRYTIFFIPLLLISFTVFLVFVFDRLKDNLVLNRLFIIGLIFFVGFYFLTNAIRLKSQVSLNLKYAERPWNYLTVQNLNSYFNKTSSAKKPVVISPLPPHYIDFYSNGNYRLLPLSKDQEFRDKKELAWGPNDYSDLIALYKSYLNQGDDVYVTPWGIGNEGYMHDSYNLIKENFELKLVQKGCYEACNIYKLELKS